MQIIQIVKRFGIVGGMEEYVFRLSIELAKLNYRVIILCEKNYSTPVTGVEVFELGIHSKPSWFAHYKFSGKVKNWLSGNLSPNMIVHSHERQSCHHISTFHTTPFNPGKPLFLRLLSLRNLFYEKLEQREIFSPSVQVIVPVSNSLGDLIKTKHPNSIERILPAIHPGANLLTNSPIKRSVPMDGGTLGFIGKEWKRKGLPKVINIWRELKKRRPYLKLKIAGVSLDMISHLLQNEEEGLEVLGIIKDKANFYQSIDLLVHPANHEAFGMVITEALTMKVPVLCSSECGAGEIIEKDNGKVLHCQEKVSQWTNHANKLLDSKFNIKYRRSWAEVAANYVNIYARLKT